MNSEYVVVSSTTTTTIDKNLLGRPISKNRKEVVKKKAKVANTKGMSLMRKKLFLSVVENTVTSSTDAKLISFISNNQSSTGFVKNTRGTPITITEIANIFSVSRKKVSSFISKLVSSKFVKKHKNVLYVNPYIDVPYAVSDKSLNALQQRWDEDFKYSLDELLEVHSTYIDEDEITYEK